MSESLKRLEAPLCAVEWREKVAPFLAKAPRIFPPPSHYRGDILPRLLWPSMRPAIVARALLASPSTECNTWA
jgi:hypothetical protein